MGYSTWSCNALGSLTGGLFSFTKVVWINFTVYTKMPSMERLSHYQHLGAVPFLISDFSQRLCFSWVMMLALWQPGEEIHRSDHLSPAIDSNAMAITKNIGQNSKVCGLFFCDNQNSINLKAAGRGYLWLLSRLSSTSSQKFPLHIITASLRSFFEETFNLNICISVLLCPALVINAL